MILFAKGDKVIPQVLELAENLKDGLKGEALKRLLDKLIDSRTGAILVNFNGKEVDSYALFDTRLMDEEEVMFLFSPYIPNHTVAKSMMEILKEYTKLLGLDQIRTGTIRNPKVVERAYGFKLHSYDMKMEVL